MNRSIEGYIIIILMLTKRLRFLLYILRYSCLHTLAARKKISLKQAINIYGLNCEIKHQIETKKKNCHKNGKNSRFKRIQEKAKKPRFIV